MTPKLFPKGCKKSKIFGKEQNKLKNKDRLWKFFLRYLTFKNGREKSAGVIWQYSLPYIVGKTKHRVRTIGKQSISPKPP